MQKNPSCASCHAYPLHDVNHAYHLMSVNVSSHTVGEHTHNGSVTCMDCHFNSIHHFSYVHTDTIWVDAAGDTITEHTLPTDRIAGLNRFTQYRPIPYGFHAATLGEPEAMRIDSLTIQSAGMGVIQEWMTSWTHDNGTVDVALAPNNVTNPDSLAAAYHPQDLSCSSIACHSSKSAKYRWMSKQKSLSPCPSLLGNDTTCGEASSAGVTP